LTGKRVAVMGFLYQPNQHQLNTKPTKTMFTESPFNPSLTLDQKLTLKGARQAIRSAGYSFASILGVGTNSKTVKSDLEGEYLTAISYLQPNRTTCPFARMAKCDVGCLNLAGRGGMSNVQNVRADRTQCFYNHNKLFMNLLVLEIRAHIRKASKKGVKPAIRLNGTSDIDWSEVARAFPEVQFYDYSKDLGRVRKNAFPSNYHVTLSYSGASIAYKARCLEILEANPALNLAVVFRDEETVKALEGSTILGRVVIDGDKTDLRFSDPKGAIVALYAKGPAKHDQTGFVVEPSEFQA